MKLSGTPLAQELDATDNLLDALRIGLREAKFFSSAQPEVQEQFPKGGVNPEFHCYWWALHEEDVDRVRQGEYPERFGRLLHKQTARKLDPCIHRMVDATDWSDYRVVAFGAALPANVPGMADLAWQWDFKAPDGLPAAAQRTTNRQVNNLVERLRRLYEKIRAVEDGNHHSLTWVGEEESELLESYLNIALALMSETDISRSLNSAEAQVQFTNMAFLLAYIIYRSDHTTNDPRNAVARYVQQHNLQHNTEWEARSEEQIVEYLRNSSSESLVRDLSGYIDLLHQFITGRQAA